ncbi:MAG: hypothetical protein WCE23_12495 [Candidatus Binatus sp.]|uniref:hypothetical protein n=1 Tax=Candidatus Binatus sp. TaxID=2811406 RepID=UPI003C721313
MANATAPAECGHSCAFQVHGAEPSTTNDAALLYVVGVGQITFAKAGTGATSCAVTSGEMIYNDNDILGFFAGPAVCGSIPCFDGGDHMSGTLSGTVGANGAAILSITPTFAWVNGSPGTGSISLSFTLQASTGESTVLGNSVALPGPSLPTGTPPANPVLTITLQKQSTTVTPPSAAGSNYGTAPYLGLSVVSCEGFGAPSGDTSAQPITGSFRSVVGALQIFPGGLAGGSLSFNRNDNVGNSSGATNDDCDFNSTQVSAYADGTSNSEVSIINPGTMSLGIYDPTTPNSNCADASALAVENTSNVVWGTTDTSSYQIVTAVGDATSGGLVPPGGEVTCTTIPSTPAGTLTKIVAPTTLTSTSREAQSNVKLTNTSPAGCDVTITMPSTSAGTCYLSLATPTYISGPVTLVERGAPSDSSSGTLFVVVEGDTPSTVYGAIQCSCTGSTPVIPTTSTLTISSSNCPNTNLLPAGETITCKN